MLRVFLGYREIDLDTREMAKNKDISRNCQKRTATQRRVRPQQVFDCTLANDGLEVGAAAFTPYLTALRMLAFLLLALFCLQPLAPVFAAPLEEDSTAQQPVVEEPSMAFVDVAEVVVSESAPVADDAGAHDAASAPVDEQPIEPAAEAGDTDDTASTTFTETSPLEPQPSEDPVLESLASNGGTDSAVSQSDATSTIETSSTEEDPTQDPTSATSGEIDVVSEESSADASSTSEVRSEVSDLPIIEPPVILVDASVDALTTTTAATTTVILEEQSALINDYNRYQFGVHECVTVADGFFYCTKSASTTVSGIDRFFSGQDSDGDFEIYLEKEGELTQITHNVHDDSAPYYDPKSDTLVWHALIDDRWQIMRYDLDDNKMTQLTHEFYNSMEPVAYGDRIVWQSWIGGDWEIMLYEDGKLSQVTDNDAYDIDPHVRDNLMSWQTRTGDEWKVVVYDLETKHIELMEASDGASVENPRFVLLYDSVKSNGDQETLGYDLKTKKVTPLGAAPEEVPDHIPEPAHDKETRALVQVAPQVKEEVISDEDTASTTPTVADPPSELPENDDALEPDEDTPATALASSSPLVTVTDVVIASSTEEIPVIDMRPQEESTGIPDLVITPHGTTTEDEVNAVE